MKSLNFYQIFFVTIVFVIIGCGNNKSNKKASSIPTVYNLTVNNSPPKNSIVYDSLIIKTPGIGQVKMPKEVIYDVPEKVKYLSEEKLTPGVSLLKQSVIEKLAGDPVKKSKLPVIKQLDKQLQKEAVSTKDKEPIITKLEPVMHLEFDSITRYRSIAIKSGTISIQNNDTIFPPVSILASNAKRIQAHPFYYKENALIDISVLDDNQELPNPFIRDIAMDKNNIIWFETHTGGLISYDGHFFDQYIDPRVLTRESGLCMIIDSKGNIWTGTKGGGVFCFDGTNITQYKIEQGLISNDVTALLEDGNGNLWLGTTKGIVKFDGITFTAYTVENGIGADYVYSILEDNAGNIWMGTIGGGVTKFNGTEFVTYTIKDGLCNDYVLSILQDRNGNYWFGTNGGGVSKFDGKSFTNYSVEQGLGNDVILAIIEDIDNNIWFGTYGSGVTYFDGESFSNYNTDHGLSDNYIRTIFEDNKGNLWIGTDGSGVSKININSFRHYTKKQGLIDNNITSIYQDNKNRLFFAPYDHGVLIFDVLKEPGQLESFININEENGLTNNIVVSITQDNNNNYWFGTYEGGVSKLDFGLLEKGILKFTNYSIESGLNSNVVRSVFHDNKGNIWFGTEGGVTKFNGIDFVTITTKNGLPANFVLSVFQDNNGAMWFGTMDGGVSCLLNDSLVNYTSNQGLGGNTVWAITQDTNGILWFGTNNGITGFNGKAFLPINEKDGLCNNQVFSMVVDSINTLWVGTLKGLSQIKLPDNSYFEGQSSESMKPEILNYGRRDGLVGLDFASNSVFIDNMNCIWWGTDNALTMLELSTFRSLTMAPIIHINDILFNEENINFKELMAKKQFSIPNGIEFDEVAPFTNNPTKLNVPYELNHLTFKFSATDLNSPNQIQYQYKIEGLDNNWSLPTKENTANYRNIPPGKYIFKARAKGKSSLWSSETEIPFTIRWPLYLKWWAILLYIVAFVFLIWTIIKWRVSIIEKQKLILEDMVGNRTKALDKALVLAKQAAEAKSQFVATISHEIRTPLNAIMGLTHLAVNSTVDPKQEDYLQKIDRSAVTLLALINEILDFSKIEAGKMELENVNFDLEFVINSVIVLNSQAAREKGLEFAINISPDVPQKLIGDPLRIGQIITNLCNNAIKFTSEGEVVIDITVEEELGKNELFLQVSVRDTGIGISDEQTPFLFDKFNQADSSITRKYGGTGLGLSISKLLIEMMEGQIWLESKLNEGTTFFFDFKIGVQSEQPISNVNIPDELLSFDILICDDNSSTLQSIETALGAFSLNISTANSGEEVIEILKKKPYDLLLIDSNMKGMSGLDTIMSIRSNDKIQPIKTILITESISSKTSFEQNISGVDGYITKPTVSSAIIKEILSVFGMANTIDKDINKKQARFKQISEALSGKQVLLAEDNEINRQVVNELLAKVGVEVDNVFDGVGVLNKALLKRYDLILMDLHMPLMDGFNAAAQIKDHDIQTPIVAITADTMESALDKCEKVGIVDIIIKPIDPELLYSKLVGWISPQTILSGFIDSESLTSNLQFPNISITELDVAGGINRFGNDRDLYTKMLKKFILSNNEIDNEILLLVNERDFNNAHIKAHSLKGESGNVGAIKVAKFAEIVEQLILKQDIDGIKNNIILLEKSLSELSNSFKEYFESEQSVIESNIASIADIGNDIINCLEIKDPKVFDYLDSLGATEMKESDYKEIEKIINEQGVEGSIALIRKILDRYTL